MAHVRKEVFTKPPQWWKHLKEYKRLVSKAERKAAAEFIKNETADLKNNLKVKKGNLVTT